MSKEVGNSKRDVDEAAMDEENERAYVMRDFRNRSATPLGDGTQVARYLKVMDLRGGYCDNVWIDRLTGKEVMRYDAADPANTNPYYGAEADGDILQRSGCDISELIDSSEAKAFPADYASWAWSDDDWLDDE
jgi:hypothetical protein